MTTITFSKRMAATAIAASTVGGVAAGAALFTPAIAGAQDDAEQAVETSRLAEVLQPLVDDGTLTETQRDAVVDTLEEARPEGFGHRGHHRGHFGGAGVLEDVLGLEGSEIREAIAGGQSIADLAAEQGVSTDDIVDAIVAQAEERLDAAVENGRIDEEQAAEMLAEAEEKATDIVNGEFEFEGRHGGPGRGFGPGGFGPDGDDADA